MDSLLVSKPERGKRTIPDVCIALIWRFLSTRDLLRFVSNEISKPLLNEQFTRCLWEVLPHRLPLAIKLAGSRFVVVDRADQTVAVIKWWIYFCDSVACEHVQSAEIRLPFVGSTMRSDFDEILWPVSWEWKTRPKLDPEILERHRAPKKPHPNDNDLEVSLYESIMIEDLFGSLRNLRELSVAICTKKWPWHMNNFVTDQLRLILDHALPQITSLKLTCENELPHDVLASMPCLEELSVSVEGSVLAATMLPLFSDQLAARLKSFAMLEMHDGQLSFEAWTGLLQELRARCHDLIDLTLHVVRSVRPYLATFHSLPSLTRLSLHMDDEALTETATDACPAITSVECLSISCPWSHLKAPYFASLLPKFPNTQELTLVLKAVRGSRFISVADVLLLTGGSQTLHRLRSLTASNAHKWSTHNIRVSDLYRVLADAKAPEKIDRAEFGCVFIRGPKSMIQLYQALKASIACCRLTIRASVNAAALPALEDHFKKEFGGNAEHLGDCVTAWIGPDVPVPPGPAEFVWAPHRYYAPTDFLIRGRKAENKDGLRLPFSLRIINSRI